MLSGTLRKRDDSRNTFLLGESYNEIKENKMDCIERIMTLEVDSHKVRCYLKKTSRAYLSSFYLTNDTFSIFP